MMMMMMMWRSYEPEERTHARAADLRESCCMRECVSRVCV